MPVNIHNKSYKTVAERLAEFVKDHPSYNIITEVTLMEGACMVKAEVTTYDKDNRSLVATGHAYEDQNSSVINKKSYIECAETSAVGRALAFLGYAGTEIASADELASKIPQQRATVTPTQAGTLDAPVSLVCSVCPSKITQAECDFSINKYGKTLCRACQKIVEDNPAEGFSM